MSIFPLKPTSSYIKAYFTALDTFKKHGHTTEGNTRSAFADLLKRGCGPYGWHLVEEFNFRGTKKQPLRADGALIDGLTLNHGIWEAKDTADDLKKEIRSKVEKGYPLNNTLFQSPDHAILYQDSRIAFDKPIDTAANLVEVLELFFDHQIVPGVDWQKVIKDFGEQIPSIAEKIFELLGNEQRSNFGFQERFAAFAELCRTSINPDLSNESIRKMLVQHLLTERIFRKVFNNQEFLQRNVIAVEIEKVIRSITDKHFSRDQFLRNLDHFYIPLEKAAEQQEDYTEKQHFLNAVYERFFQSFDPKQADTMGIVYTPQPIVDFMVRSVEEILKQEFNQSFSDENVHILDPFTGTGNFITRIMQEIKRSALPHKYAHELHCNEIMLLPYYIASMNIEHAYLERSGKYRPFDGICLVDTFETLGQSSFFSSENTARVLKQAAAPIRIVIGNPPYNMGQDSEDKRNRNRKYVKKGQVDTRIAATYMKSSSAQLKNKLGDPYIKAFRWASDRIADHGIVCFVTNNKFLAGISTDGMRKHLALDFDKILHLNFKGNANTAGERRKREGGNIFDDQIKVGIGITLLIKKSATGHKGVYLYSVDDCLRAKDKTRLLNTFASFNGVPLKRVVPDANHNWLEITDDESFAKMVPLAGSKGVSRSAVPGINTARDAYLYNWDTGKLQASVKKMRSAYMQYLVLSKGKSLPEIEALTPTDDPALKWSPRLWQRLKAGRQPEDKGIMAARLEYRPFTNLLMNANQFWIERPGILAEAYTSSSVSNQTISWSGKGGTAGFYVLATKYPVDFHFLGDTKTISFYSYKKGGSDREESIRQSTLHEFRTQYGDESITKWNVFHATYAILHHPEYRTLYAANLKRELPRIPFPPDFHAFAAAGQRLMELHIDYEQQPEYPLEQIEDPKADISFRVQKMKLSKDKTELRYNDFLLLRGIPAGVYDYRLGNRSALEWVIDQYQVSTDKRSGIVNDPNREDDPMYILRLIGQVITVSLETNEIIASLPSLNFS